MRSTARFRRFAPPSRSSESCPLPRATDIEFGIVSPWSPELMTVRWFVDGSEVELARGRYSYALHADGGRHDVRVTIADGTDRIRAPGAREQTGAVDWTVSQEPGIAASKALAKPARIGGWIRMRVDASGHTVLGIDLGDPRRARAPGRSEDSGFEYALFDAGGAVLAAGQIADPRVVRGPLPAPGMPAAGHGIATLESGYYLIGIPEGVNARKLRIRAVTGMEKAGTESTTGIPPTEQWLDL